MDITKVLKFQIKPTIEPIALLNETAEVYRNACNFVSENVFNINKEIPRGILPVG